MNYGDVYLAVGEELQSSVISSRSLLKISGDRVGYDVYKDPDRSRISMSEMMTRIPELRTAARDGKLEFDNQKITRILIDDEENGIVNVRRQYPMEFIKVSYMRRIEVVYPGSAEYGNKEPLLLITLSKPLPYGFAGNIQASADTKNSYSPSVDFVANTVYIGVGAGYDYNYSAAPALTNETIREMSDGSLYDSYSTSRDRSCSHNMRANVFRGFLNDRIKFNANLRGGLSEASSFSESSMNAETTASSNGTSHSPFRLNGGARISGGFGKDPLLPGRWKDRWTLEYMYTDNYEKSDINHIYPTTTAGQASISENKEHRIQSKLELRDIIRRPFIMSGTANAGWYHRSFGESSSYGGVSNGMNYMQDVAFVDIAAIGSFFKKKLGYFFTLKAEHIGNDGYFLNAGAKSDLKYNEFNLIPVAALSWEMKRSAILFSYTASVLRPKMTQLNPYLDITDPYNIRTGNPNLKGSRTDNYHLGYKFRPSVKWLKLPDLALDYSSTGNLVASIVSVDETGVATRSFSNLGKASAYGISTSFTLTPVNRMDISFRASYMRNITLLPSGNTNTFDSPNMSVSLMWHPEWFDLHGSFVLLPSLNSVQIKNRIMEPRMELSIARYFKNPHIGVSLDVSDILHSGGRKESVIYYDNFIQRNLVERIGRTFNFRVYLRFGKFVNQKDVDVKAYDM